MTDKSIISFTNAGTKKIYAEANFELAKLAILKSQHKL